MWKAAVQGPARRGSRSAVAGGRGPQEWWLLMRLRSCLATVSISFCLSRSFFRNWAKTLFFLLVSRILRRAETVGLRHARRRAKPRERNAGEVPRLEVSPTGSSPRFCVKMGTPSRGKLCTVCISALNPDGSSPRHLRVPAPKANRCDNPESLMPLVLPFRLITWQMTVLEY